MAMTEDEWLVCANSRAMRDFIRLKTSKRKLRLFAAACFRRLSRLLPDDRQQQAVEMLEDTPEEVEERKDVVRGVRHALPSPTESFAASSTDDPFFVGLMLYRELVSSSTARHATIAPDGLVNSAAEQLEQCRLLRCIVGNPFRPVPQLPHDVLAWNDRTVRRIAEGIYAERAFGRMPILHDALLDAGCTDEVLLAHCRNPEGHVRGCWALDLILDKH